MDKEDTSSPVPDENTLFGWPAPKNGLTLCNWLLAPSVWLIGNAFLSAPSGDWSSRVAIYLVFLIAATYSAVKRYSTLSLGLTWYLMSLYLFISFKLKVQFVLADFISILIFALATYIAYRRSGPDRRHKGDATQ